MEAGLLQYNGEVVASETSSVLSQAKKSQLTLGRITEITLFIKHLKGERMMIHVILEVTLLSGLCKRQMNHGLL